MLFKILLGALWLVILVFSPPFAVFVIIGLAPAMVSSFVDIKPGKNTSATVLFFNLAGVTIPGMKFINGEESLNFDSVLAFDKLLVVYLFACMGYFVVWLVPKIVVIIVDIKNERRAFRIKEKISTLVEEWGPEVRK